MKPSSPNSFNTPDNACPFMASKQLYGKCCLLLCDSTATLYDKKAHVDAYLDEIESALRTAGPILHSVQSSLEIFDVGDRLRNLVNSPYFKDYRNLLKSDNPKEYSWLITRLIALETDVRGISLSSPATVTETVRGKIDAVLDSKA